MTWNASVPVASRCPHRRERESRIVATAFPREVNGIRRRAVSGLCWRLKGGPVLTGMDGRADLDALFRAHAAGQPQHLGAIRLHREIAQGAVVYRRRNLHSPAEYGVQVTIQHCIIQVASDQRQNTRQVSRYRRKSPRARITQLRSPNGFGDKSHDTGLAERTVFGPNSFELLNEKADSRCPK
jgi:hypothetical protein